MMSKATNVPAQLIEGENKYERAGQEPGAFYYYKFHGDGPDEPDKGILHWCPCGCGHFGSLPLVKQEGKPSWTNSGSREKPTLSPSVGFKTWNGDTEADGFHWHGHLRNGVWESC